MGEEKYIQHDEDGHEWDLYHEYDDFIIGNANKCQNGTRSNKVIKKHDSQNRTYSSKHVRLRGKNIREKK